MVFVFLGILVLQLLIKVNIVKYSFYYFLRWKKKRWCERDTYVRKRKELRSHESGQAAEQIPKWKFLDQMGFLDQHTEGAQ